MRDLKFILKPKYETSRALVIGINQYLKAPPLQYAVNDAKEVKELLTQELGFNDENIIYLTDCEATKENITRKFISFTDDNIGADDRVFVFFAGHGHTREGIRGDVGFLVPYDADMDDFSTFIRWDDLTKNAELIRAKHILFVMDACYGGLAVHRDLKPGSNRFLKDMYQRLSRQVITAGKANEVVSDSGGPLPEHSIFTGHFIEGIKGKAANDHGVITASGLMAYVYSKVSNDINSQQTPHYGQFDGDGDFIIRAPSLKELSVEDKRDIDELIAIPYADEISSRRTSDEKITYVKELLSSEKAQIKLHDFVIEEVRKFLSLTSEDSFAVGGDFSDDEFLRRLSTYENYTKDLSAISACMAHWSTEQQLNALTKILSRSCDRLLETKGGITIWLKLRWYPLILLIYNAGISAVESNNYKALSNIFYQNLGIDEYSNNESLLVQRVATVTGDLKDAFNRIPGHERNYTPVSEYLFKLLQPTLDDLLFLGKGYEASFDKFEILFALATADSYKQSDAYIWGPIGRFGWKHKSFRQNSPFDKLVKEAAEYREKWPPLEGGLFGGKYERFNAIVEHFQKDVFPHLSWH